LLSYSDLWVVTLLHIINQLEIMLEIKNAYCVAAIWRIWGESQTLKLHEVTDVKQNVSIKMTWTLDTWLWRFICNISAAYFQVRFFYYAINVLFCKWHSSYCLILQVTQFTLSNFESDPFHFMSFCKWPISLCLIL